MKAVLISIRPQWCAQIANGKKTVDVRKSRPKIETPFKCYIYCTKGRPQFTQSAFCGEVSNGKVVGEFVCDDVSLLTKAHYEYIEKCACISREELKKYMGLKPYQELDYSNGCYGWHISDLMIYDEPKELSEFYRICDEWEKGEFTPKCRRCYNYERNDADMCYVCCVEGELSVERPPQSWCYVEEI